MNKKKRLVTITLATLAVLAVCLIVGIKIHQAKQASTDQPPKLTIIEDTDHEYQLKYEAVAGDHSMTITSDGTGIYQLDSRTGISTLYENGELISTGNAALIQAEHNHTAVLLNYADKQILDDFAHKLWNNQASLDKLPKELNGQYEFHALETGYEVRRLFIDGVISSGPSRYIYRYDAPLSEQADGPTRLVAYRDADGSMTIEFSAPSGISEITVDGNELKLKFTHALTDKVININYPIAADIEELHEWTASENEREPQDQKLLDAYLEDLPLDLVDSLPPLPAELENRYVIHHPVESSGFIIEHLPEF